MSARRSDWFQPGRPHPIRHMTGGPGALKGTPNLPKPDADCTSSGAPHIEPPRLQSTSVLGPLSLSSVGTIAMHPAAAARTVITSPCRWDKPIATCSVTPPSARMRVVIAANRVASSQPTPWRSRRSLCSCAFASSSMNRAPRRLTSASLRPDVESECVLVVLSSCCTSRLRRDRAAPSSLIPPAADSLHPSPTNRR